MEHGHHGAPPDGGFTLIEVLVAFVIAALALGALFQATAASLGSTGAAARYGEALSPARSHLATIDHGAPLGIARQQGEEGNGFHWAIAVTPIDSAPARLADPVTHATVPPLGLYAVQVTESWDTPNGRSSVRLVTRRIGQAAP